jgi:hypothetical protein
VIVASEIRQWNPGRGWLIFCCHMARRVRELRTGSDRIMVTGGALKLLKRVTTIHEMTRSSTKAH